MESFSVWYYRAVVGQGIKAWQVLVLLTFDTFSIPLLAKTLLAPWRRDVVKPSQPGLNLIFQALAFNLVSRLIGLLIRLATITTGLLLTGLMGVFGAAAMIILAALPTAIFLGLVTALIFLTNPILLTVGLLMVGLSVVGLVIAYLYFRQVARLNPPLPEPLSSMLGRIKSGQRVYIEPYLEGSLARLIHESHSLTDLYQRILDQPDVRFVIDHAALPHGSISRLVIPANRLLRDAIIEAASLSDQLKLKRVTATALFIVLFRLVPAAKTVLTQHNLSIDDLVEVVGWYHRLDRLAHPISPLLDLANLRSTGGIGRDWAYGYTALLDQFTRELTGQLTKSFGDHFLAHQDSIDQIERILARSGKHNVLLIGEPGIGKRTVLLGLTWRIHFGQALRPLRHRRVLELDVSAVLASRHAAGDLEARLVGILNDAVSAGNIILFVDRLERLFGAESGEAGTVNAGEILVPYLESSSLQLVGTTNYTDYHRFFERLPAVVSQFEKVEVLEPTNGEVQLILEEVTPAFEVRHGLVVTYQALKEIIKVCQRYLTNRKFPEKAIDLLDEAAVHLAASRHAPYLLPEHIDEVIAQKTHVPVGRVEAPEQEKLLNLEVLLHERVVNQNEAIEAIAQALRRGRSGVGRTDRPIGTFLFLGPTGVGKTESAKALAAIYFGSEKTLIRLDMNEYQEVASINRLTGGPGFESGGIMTNAIKERPFAVVLLDEVEKAHPNVLNIFLQLLDEGRLQDGLGEVVDFTNTLIIGTSNAGAEMIRERVKQAASSMAHFKDELIEYLQRNNIFRPEFLNRFDAVVTFRPLTKAELIKVVDLYVGRINKNLTEKDMAIVLTPQAAAKLAEVGFDPQFGARALARAMQQKVENLVADKILRNQLRPGQTLEISDDLIV